MKRTKPSTPSQTCQLFTADIQKCRSCLHCHVHTASRFNFIPGESVTVYDVCGPFQLNLVSYDSRGPAFGTAMIDVSGFLPEPGFLILNWSDRLLHLVSDRIMEGVTITGSDTDGNLLCTAAAGEDKQRYTILFQNEAYTVK